MDRVFLVNTIHSKSFIRKSCIVYFITVNIMDSVFKTFLNGEMKHKRNKYLCRDLTVVVSIS